MDTRYNKIGAKFRYHELWITKERSIIIHKGIVGTDGEWDEVIPPNKDFLGLEYNRILKSIEQNGFKKIHLDDFSRMIVQIELMSPFNEQEFQRLKKVYHNFHQELCLTGNGVVDNVYRFEVFNNSVIYHIYALDKTCAIKTLSRTLRENNIQNFNIGELSSKPAGKILYPLEINGLTFTNFKSLDFSAKFRKFIDVSKLKKVTEIMDENLYWGIIHKSVLHTSTLRAQEIHLTLELSSLPPAKILGFYLRTSIFEDQLSIPNIECADFLINGGSGDDGFMDFRRWIISRGKETFYESLKDADYLLNEVIEGWEHHSFQSFGYVSLDAFEIITGEDPWPYLGKPHKIDTQLNIKNKNKNEDSWHPANPSSIETICPKLFDAFWRKIESSKNYQLYFGKK